MEIIAVNKLKGIKSFDLIFDTEHDLCIAPTVKAYGCWEAAMSVMALRMIKAGQTVVDIGANVGYYTILFSQIVGENGTVYSFEPEPQNFKNLYAASILNGCENVVCLEQAVGSMEGELTLYLSPNNLGDHRLTEVEGRVSHIVPVTTLDSVCGDKHVDFIKIDTQGYELNVLRGMHRVVDKNREHLCCFLEFSPGLLERSGTNFDEFYQELKKQDAQIFINFSSEVFTIDGYFDAGKIRLSSIDESELRQMYLSLINLGEEHYHDLFIFFSDQAIHRHCNSIEIYRKL